MDLVVQSLKEKSKFWGFLQVVYISFSLHLILLAGFFEYVLANNRTVKIEEVFNSLYELKMWRWLVVDKSVILGISALIISLLIANAVSPVRGRSENEYKYNKKLVTLTNIISLIGYFVSIFHINALLVFFLKVQELGVIPLEDLVSGVIGVLVFHHGAFNAIADSRVASTRKEELLYQGAEKIKLLTGYAEKFSPDVKTLLMDSTVVNLDYSRISKKIFKTKFILLKNIPLLIIQGVSSVILISGVYQKRLEAGLVYSFFIVLVAFFLYSVFELIARERVSRRIGIEGKIVDIVFEWIMLGLSFIMLIIIALLPISLAGDGSRLYLAFVGGIFCVSIFIVYINIKTIYNKDIFLNVLVWVLLNRHLDALRRELKANIKIIEGDKKSDGE